MAVVIRLQRHGRTKRPFYRIVAIDSRNRRDGRELERLGWYDPLISNENIDIKEDRINYWIENGANTSDAVHGLFKKIGFNMKRELQRQGKSQEEIEKLVSEYLVLKEDNRLKKIESKKQAKVSDAPSSEAPAEAASEEAPVEEAPVEEAPAEAASEEVPVEEAPVEEAPAEKDLEKNSEDKKTAEK